MNFKILLILTLLYTKSSNWPPQLQDYNKKFSYLVYPVSKSQETKDSVDKLILKPLCHHIIMHKDFSQKLGMFFLN